MHHGSLKTKLLKEIQKRKHLVANLFLQIMKDKLKPGLKKPKANISINNNGVKSLKFQMEDVVGVNKT